MLSYNITTTTTTIISSSYVVVVVVVLLFFLVIIIMLSSSNNNNKHQIYHRSTRIVHRISTVTTAYCWQLLGSRIMASLVSKKGKTTKSTIDRAMHVRNVCVLAMWTTAKQPCVTHLSRRTALLAKTLQGK